MSANDDFLARHQGYTVAGWPSPKPPAPPAIVEEGTPHLFVLRSRDGQIVADGVEFADGSCAVRWRGDHPSTVVWPSLSDAYAIHCERGQWVLVYR